MMRAQEVSRSFVWGTKVSSRRKLFSSTASKGRMLCTDSGAAIRDRPGQCILFCFVVDIVWCRLFGGGLSEYVCIY